MIWKENSRLERELLLGVETKVTFLHNKAAVTIINLEAATLGSKRAKLGLEAQVILLIDKEGAAVRCP